MGANPRGVTNEEEDMAGFSKILNTAFQQLKNAEEDGGKRLPIKAPKTFDGCFTKFRGWWESINEYLAIHQREYLTTKQRSIPQKPS